MFTISWFLNGFNICIFYDDGFFSRVIKWWRTQYCCRDLILMPALHVYAGKDRQYIIIYIQLIMWEVFVCLCSQLLFMFAYRGCTWNKSIQLTQGSHVRFSHAYDYTLRYRDGVTLNNVIGMSESCVKPGTEYTKHRTFFMNMLIWLHDKHSGDSWKRLKIFNYDRCFEARFLSLSQLFILITLGRSCRYDKMRSYKYILGFVLY